MSSPCPRASALLHVHVCMCACRGQVLHQYTVPADRSLMARPLRLEPAGGLYHVTCLDDRREDIYLDDTAREMSLEVFLQVCARFNWVCHAWC